MVVNTGASVRDLERATAEMDLLDFLDYVQIPDPPPEGSGSVLFTKPDHILRLHDACESLPPGSVFPLLKARKLYVTSYFEARFLHKQYLTNAFIPVLSQGEVEAKKVISDCLYIWEHLPEHLQVGMYTPNAERLRFHTGTVIEAFPSTPKAGRSFTGTEILMDEADFHEYFIASFEALLPLINDTGGKLFAVSTPNYDRVDSDFRQVYLSSPYKLYLGYYDRPGRTDETYKHAAAQSRDKARFEKENSRTEEEALAPPRASAYFDPDIVAWMLTNEAQPPMEQLGPLAIWKPPAVGRHYILASDTAWGKHGSFSAASVSDWATAEQVAELHGRLPPNELAYEIVELHKRYNHAYMGLERAGEGQERDGDSVVVVDKVAVLLQDCSCRQGKRVPRLYYHDHLVPEPKQPGWQTDGKSRPVMLGEWREAVRERQVTIRSRGGLMEMQTFIQNEAGRPEASRGAFDDRVMAYAIGWQMRKYAKFAVPTSNKRVVVPAPF